MRPSKSTESQALAQARPEAIVGEEKDELRMAANRRWAWSTATMSGKRCAFGRFDQKKHPVRTRGGVIQKESCQRRDGLLRLAASSKRSFDTDVHVRPRERARALCTGQVGRYAS